MLLLFHAFPNMFASLPARLCCQVWHGASCMNGFLSISQPLYLSSVWFLVASMHDTGLNFSVVQALLTFVRVVISGWA
ncbi:hypothetical protein BKA64DRAFT_666173 [Cadophora sp. MPI-SDFR-AT-0126]|nr:hypothetical protein BKA64DRAFT_666173 [Leotiomycetes sp. MPI-SDFR-AT-0126]